MIFDYEERRGESASSGRAKNATNAIRLQRVKAVPRIVLRQKFLTNRMSYSYHCGCKCADQRA